MSLQSESVSTCVWIFLIQQTLILQTSFAFLLFCIDPLLVTDCFFHVHGESPVCLTFEDQDVKIFFVELTFLVRDNLWRVILHLLCLVSPLLQEMQYLSEAVNLAHAESVVSMIVVVSKTILILCTFDE